MKIIDRVSTEIRFGDLKCGDTFKIFGDIFMKTNPIAIKDGDFDINAINLCLGFLHSFPDDEIILPVHVEAIVTSKTEL